MGWTLALLPDERAQQAVQRLWGALRQGGFHSALYEGESLPHLSLVLLSGQDGTLAERADKLSGGLPQFSVTLSSLGSFAREVLYLAPQPLGSLLQAHRQTVAALGPMAGLCDGYYLPGVWQPHLSLAVDLEGSDYTRAKSIVSSLFTPIACRFTELAVIKYHPAVITQRFPLPPAQDGSF